jgi:hypothetical protein
MSQSHREAKNHQPRGVSYNMNTYERFISKIQMLSEPASCWVWKGCVDNKGRARFLIDGKNTLAKIYSYEHYNSRTASLPIIQSCDNPACVNPKHLREEDRNGPKHKFSREDILAYKKSGLSTKEIAAKLGCSESLVRKVGST